MQFLFAALLAVGVVLGLHLGSAAADGCTFQLGFAALESQIPQAVGTCLEDQHYAANGDAQQLTTGGLLVWRKADNWTAFTDGYHTWINGPLGVQERLNVQRFLWEDEEVAPANEVPPSPQEVAICGGTNVPTTGVYAHPCQEWRAHHFDVLASQNQPTFGGQSGQTAAAPAGIPMVVTDIATDGSAARVQNSSGAWILGLYSCGQIFSYRNQVVYYVDNPRSLNFPDGSSCGVSYITAD